MNTSLSVGPYEVLVLLDGTYDAPISDLLHATDPAKRDRAIAAWPGERWAVDVNCFALNGPDGLILVDAGTGDHWGPAYGHAISRLCDAGFAPEQVRVVLLTHIHGDHSLGLIDGDAARFPNAEVYVPAGDLNWYGTAANAARTPEGVSGGFRNLELIRNAYGGRVKSARTGPILPCITAIALPGHTPGHTGYLIRDDDAARSGHALFLFGDIVHLDDLQLADPAFGFAYDLDPAQALHSREHALAMAAREGWYVGGGHVRGLRRIVNAGRGFAYSQENSG